MDTENIKYQNEILAIIVYSSFKKPGIHFFTGGEVSQQLAYLNHPKGKLIEPHIHNRVNREVVYTQEVLFIKSGRLRVDFYSENKKFVESRILNKGDVLLLMKGGHGFEMMDEVEIIEVKQGPYLGDNDKIRFKPDNRNK